MQTGDPITDAAIHELAELRRDKARLDYLCDHCYFPHEEPLNGFSLAAGCDVMPLGSVTLNLKKDRESIRAAIDRVRS